MSNSVTQCVLRKGTNYIRAVHIPTRLATLGTVIDYKVDWHIWWTCRPDRPCTCNLGWRPGWTVCEVWGTTDYRAQDIDGRTVKTVYAVKARRGAP